jgi:hypothetical protein
MAKQLPNMAQLDTLDLIVLAVLLAGTVAYFTKGTYWGVPKDPWVLRRREWGQGRTDENILEKMNEADKNCHLLRLSDRYGRGLRFEISQGRLVEIRAQDDGCRFGGL